MSIAHPIGYPTYDPMNHPTVHPNRGRIARIESCRVVSSPSLRSPTTQSSLSDATARHAWVVNL